MTAARRTRLDPPPSASSTIDLSIATIISASVYALLSSIVGPIVVENYKRRTSTTAQSVDSTGASPGASTAFGAPSSSTNDVPSQQNGVEPKETRVPSAGMFAHIF